MPSRRLQQEHLFQLLQDTFSHYGKEITGGTEREASKLFNSQFGASPFICSHIWRMIELHRGGNIMPGACPKKLLWAMLFLKTYAKEDTRKKLCEADKKTLRKWVWYFVNEIASLAPYVVSKNLFPLCSC
jgi:hypothetical protein